jgi:hypothetical protein
VKLFNVEVQDEFLGISPSPAFGVVEKILALLGMATGKIFRIYSSDSPK